MGTYPSSNQLGDLHIYSTHYQPPRIYHHDHPSNPPVAKATDAHHSSQIHIHPPSQPTLSKFLMEPVDDLDEQLQRMERQHHLPELVPINAISDNDILTNHIHQLFSIHHFLLVFGKHFIQWIDEPIPNMRKI